MDGLQFEVVGHQDEVVEVRLVGELDLASASVVEVGIYQLLGTDASDTIIVDLSELSFCDAAGLNLFAAAERSAAKQDKTIVLSNPRGIVAEVLETVKFDQTINIAHSGGDDDRETSSGGGSGASEGS